MLQYIGEYLRENDGRSPTLAEIGEGCGVSSVGTVHRYLSSIEDKGFLDKARSGWRTRLTPGRLPFLGKIAAGRPIEAIENADTIDLLEKVAQPGCFVLSVEGDSMIDCGILPDDLVVISPSNTARDGQIVVALVGDEATLKEFRSVERGRRIKLVPRNSKYEAKIYLADEVEIRGILRSVVRTGLS